MRWYHQNLGGVRGTGWRGSKHRPFAAVNRFCRVQA